MKTLWPAQNLKQRIDDSPWHNLRHESRRPKVLSDDLSQDSPKLLDPHMNLRLNSVTILMSFFFFGSWRSISNIIRIFFRHFLLKNVSPMANVPKVSGAAEPHHLQRRHQRLRGSRHLDSSAGAAERTHRSRRGGWSREVGLWNNHGEHYFVFFWLFFIPFNII